LAFRALASRSCRLAGVGAAGLAWASGRGFIAQSLAKTMQPANNKPLHAKSHAKPLILSWRAGISTHQPAKINTSHKNVMFFV
jgi:hypothetical protein